MAVEVGSAYVTIMPSLRGFGKELSRQMSPELSQAGKDLSKDLGDGMGAGAEKEGEKVGAKVGKGASKGFKLNFDKAITNSLKAVSATVAGIAGTALFQGFTRLKDIDNAKAQLAGLGHSGQEVKTIMDNALASVKGTAFGMGEAAKVAGVIVASGVSQGKDLERVMKLVADSAAIANTSLGDMGTIWAKVAATGRLQGDEMNQLTERGIPILQMLADHYKVTAGEASKMVSKGKVDFATFATVMEDKMGGAALKSGQTFEGALRNVGAALGRLGAAVLGPAFAGLAATFGDMSVKLDTLGPQMTAFGEALGNSFVWAKENATWLVPLVASLTAMAVAYKVTALAMTAYATVLAVVRAETLAAALAQLGLNAAWAAHPIGLIIVAVAGLIAGLVALYHSNETFRNAIDATWQAIKDAVSSVVSWFTDTAIPALKSGWGAVVDVWDAAATGITDAWAGVTGWFADAWQTVKDAAASMATAVREAWDSIYAGASTVAAWFRDTFTPIIEGAFFVLRFAVGVVATVFVVAFMAISAIVKFVVNEFMTMVLPKWIAAFEMLKGAAKFVWDVMVQVWEGIKTAVNVVVAWFASWAVPVWNAAVTVFVMFAERMRAQLAAVWAAVQAVVKTVVDWFMSWAVPAWNLAVAVLTAYAERMRAQLAAIWAAVRAAIDVVVAWFVSVAMTTWNNAVTVFLTVARGMQATIGIIWAAIQAVIKAVSDWFVTNVVPRWNAAWETVRAALGAGWSWMRDNVWKPLEDRVKAIPGIFNNMVKLVKSAWGQFEDVAKKPVRFVIDTIIVDGIARAWNMVADKLSLPKWDIQKVSWDTGGWTGPGSKYQPAGIVHADEYVIRKESQQRLASRHPGLLDYMNRHGAVPGYAGGGQVWANMWAWARGHLPGMQLTSAYRPGSNDFHGAGKAIDLAAPMNSAGMAAMLRAANIIYSTFGSQILELIHTPAGPGKQIKYGKPINYGAATAAQHVNHVHWAMQSFGADAIDRAAGEVGELMSASNPVASALKALLGAPFDFASKGIGVIGSKFGDSPWTQMITAFAKKPFDAVKKFLDEKIDGVFPPIEWDGSSNSIVGDVSRDWRATSGVNQWRSVALEALKMTGQPPTKLTSLLKRMQQESGGNARARNDWDCLPLRTKILTKRGWLAHEEVVIGDETIGYDPTTGRNAWTRVTRVVRYEDADIIRIGGKRWSVESTPNHRWLVEKRNGRRAMVVADEMAVNDAVILSAAADTGEGLPITDAEAALLGWIAGDGTVERGRRGASMSVAQSKREHFPAIEEAFAGVQHARYAYPDRTECVTWRMTPTAARDLMGRAGHPKDDALRIVLGMSASQRDAWLDAMIRAEGSSHDGYTVVYQCDGPVREALKAAIYLSGHRPSESLLTGKPQWRDCWAHGLTKPRLGGGGRSVSASESQDVWCVTTELGTWTAEQDGQVFLTGNSNAASGNNSVGLMQLVPGTFRQYAMPGYNRDIYDPLSNILASIRYALARYGSLEGAYNRKGGYALGGLVLDRDQGGYLPPGLSLVNNRTGRDELVLSPQQEAKMMGGGTIVINTVDRDRVDDILREIEHATRVSTLTRRYR